MKAQPLTQTCRAHVELALVLELLQRGTPARVLARGHSMRPAVTDNSTILVAPISPSRPLKLGAVVMALTPHDEVLVHRIVGTNHLGEWLLKGDACPGPDGWFQSDRIVGVVR